MPDLNGYAGYFRLATSEMVPAQLLSHLLSSCSWEKIRSPRQHCVTVFKASLFANASKGMGGLTQSLVFQLSHSQARKAFLYPVHARQSQIHICTKSLCSKTHSFHISFVKRHFDICA